MMFGMGPFTPTAASHNSFPPFPMMPNSGDFMPQSFAPQLPANSPPSQVVLCTFVSLYFNDEI